MTKKNKWDRLLKLFHPRSSRNILRTYPAVNHDSSIIYLGIADTSPLPVQNSDAKSFDCHFCFKQDLTYPIECGLGAYQTPSGRSPNVCSSFLPLSTYLQNTCAGNILCRNTTRNTIKHAHPCLLHTFSASQSIDTDPVLGGYNSHSRKDCFLHISTAQPRLNIESGGWLQRCVRMSQTLLIFSTGSSATQSHPNLNWSSHLSLFPQVTPAALTQTSSC